MTYYELLGVPPSASPNELRGAYRRAVRRYHPDVNKAPDALRLTMMLNEAWATLGDPASRSAYDRRIGIGAPTYRPYAQQRQTTTAYAQRPTATTYSRRPASTYAPHPNAYAYRQAPFQASAVDSPGFGALISGLVGGSLRILLLVAFVASVIHWFPLVAAVCVGVIGARAARRFCR